MNERITRLIIEADKYATEKHQVPKDADAMTISIIIGNRISESQRKLAELIIQECINICDAAANNQADKVTPLVTDKLVIEGAKAQAGKLSEAIKEHFEVKRYKKTIYDEISWRFDEDRE